MTQYFWFILKTKKPLYPSVAGENISTNVSLSMLLQPNNDISINEPTIGKAILKSKGLFTSDSGFWLSIGAMIGFTILFNIFYILALTYLSREYHYFLLSGIIG
jgi:hypothetical protein